MHAYEVDCGTSADRDKPTYMVFIIGRTVMHNILFLGLYRLLIGIKSVHDLRKVISRLAYRHCRQ